MVKYKQILIKNGEGMGKCQSEMNENQLLIDMFLYNSVINSPHK